MPRQSLIAAVTRGFLRRPFTSGRKVPAVAGKGADFQTARLFSRCDFSQPEVVIDFRMPKHGFSGFPRKSAILVFMTHRIAFAC